MTSIQRNPFQVGIAYFSFEMHIIDNFQRSFINSFNWMLFCKNDFYLLQRGLLNFVFLSQNVDSRYPHLCPGPSRARPAPSLHSYWAPWGGGGRGVQSGPQRRVLITPESLQGVRRWFSLEHFGKLEYQNSLFQAFQRCNRVQKNH